MSEENKKAGKRYKILAIYLINNHSDTQPEGENSTQQNENISPKNKQSEMTEEDRKFIDELLKLDEFELEKNKKEEIDSMKVNDNMENYTENFFDSGLKDILTEEELKILQEIDPNAISSNTHKSELEEFNIHDLYLSYDHQFFEGLLGPVKLEWSKRMTQCAGIFSVRGTDISIRLSEPLLKFRSIKEIKETLLHEMTHAYLFMKGIEAGRDGHGPKFLEKIGQINKITGLNLTVYHTFHDEVDYYKTHIWKCDGKCQNEKPFYGLVKRSMNRPPGPSDFWWEKHLKDCGGKFVKISEPENYKKKGKKEEKVNIIEEDRDRKNNRDKDDKNKNKVYKKENDNQRKIEDLFKKK